jgi:D-3-phosphoglycerate dehydrogenase / 2-oxoglutarate reductase
MPNVLVAGQIHRTGVDLLRSTAGLTVDYVEGVSVEAYRPFVPHADAILIRTQPLPAEVIAQAPLLQVVSRHGVGYDAVDVAALNSRRIPLAVVGDVNSRSVAEHTMMLLLASARRLIRYDRSVRTGEWRYRDSLEAVELDGKRLLIVGFGRIGRRVARMAAAFGLICAAHDPFQDGEAIRAAGVEPVTDLLAGLAEADFVTVHIPKSGAVALIGASELSRMKPGAIIVNTARGGLVDEAALVAAIRAGRIGGAALDVFAEEPPAPGLDLLGEDRLILTPHCAGLTEECAARMAVAAARNILDHFAGRLDPTLVVNRHEALGVPAAT